MTILAFFQNNSSAPAIASTSSGGSSTTPSVPVTSGQGTKLNPINIIGGGYFAGCQAFPVIINYDTANANYLIWKTSPGKRAYLVGLTGVNGAAVNDSYKSGSNLLLLAQLGANSGLVQSFSATDPQIMLNTNPGESLILSADGTVATMTAYVIERD